MTNPSYPVRLEGDLARNLSRSLWLVKWLLLIPHLIVLGFLWFAFVVLTVVAFVKQLRGGRYPRWIFDFNLGVVPWTWRVNFCGCGALGTDRDYPARLEIDYPDEQATGQGLLSTWLADPGEKRLKREDLEMGAAPAHGAPGARRGARTAPRADARQDALLVNSSVALGFGNTVSEPGLASVNSVRKALPCESRP